MEPIILAVVNAFIALYIGLYIYKEELSQKFKLSLVTHLFHLWNTRMRDEKIFKTVKLQKAQ